MIKLLRLAWLVAFACALFAYPVVWGIAGTATEAYLIVPKDPTAVMTEKALFDAKKTDPDYRFKVIEIYGNRVTETTPVVFVSKEKFQHPEEDATITLLPLRDDNPLQVKTLYWFAPRVAAGAAVTGLMLLGAWALLRRKAAAGSPARRG